MYSRLPGALQPRHLAVCWAVKEATYKALPTRADFTAIEFYKKDGKPCVKVEGYSALVSVSHEGSLVMASVIVYN